MERYRVPRWHKGHDLIGRSHPDEFGSAQRRRVIDEWCRVKLYSLGVLRCPLRSKNRTGKSGDPVYSRLGGLCPLVVATGSSVISSASEGYGEAKHWSLEWLDEMMIACGR